MKRYTKASATVKLIYKDGATPRCNSVSFIECSPAEAVEFVADCLNAISGEHGGETYVGITLTCTGAKSQTVRIRTHNIDASLEAMKETIDMELGE